MSNFDYQMEIIAYKGSHFPQSENIGKLNVLFQKIDNMWVSATEESFCKTRQVFVPSLFTTIEENKLFRFKVKDNDRPSERDDQCKYITCTTSVQSGNNSQKPDYKLDFEEIKPKEFIQVVDVELPDAEIKMINLDFLPLTDYIFINDNLSDFLYGPFEWRLEAHNINGYSIKIIWSNALFIHRLDKYFNYKINKKLIDEIYFENNGFGRGTFYFLNNSDNFLLKSFSKFDVYDYASTDDFLEFGIEELKSIVRMNPNTLKSLQNNMKTNEFKSTLERHIKQEKLSVLQRQRLDRFLQIISDSIPDDVYKSDIVEQFVYNVVSHDPDKYNVKDEADLSSIAEAQKKLNNIKNEIFNNQQESSVIEKKLQKLKQDELKLKDLENSIIEKEKRNLELDNFYSQESKRREDSINEKIESRQKELLELRSQLSLGEDIASFVKKKDYLEQNVSELQSKIDNKEALLKKSDTELKNRISEFKFFSDQVNGSFTITNHNVEPRNLECYDLAFTEENKKILVNTIISELAKHDRFYKDWQVANLLICLQQSFITIFAGLPGTGKTSLARLLSKVQMLDKRMLEISVARGWTSEKDLIGYYNPLTSAFQPSATGLYSFLKSLSNESNVESDQAMAFVLLDEANLSPIEHYWSKFNSMTDTYDENNKKLSISGTEYINIPNYLRFIATINYDGTTEVLSPRIIDRAPIIILGRDDMLFEEVERTLDKLPVSAKNMDLFFGRSRSSRAEFTEQESVLFNSLKDILGRVDSTLGLGISISYRKETSIKEYCAQARSIMSATNDLLAFDLAFLQFILPQIKGHGESFINRIKILLSKLEEYELQHSSDYLTRMLNFAELEFGSIDFFCW